MGQFVNRIGKVNPIPISDTGSNSRRTTSCGEPEVTFVSRTSQPRMFAGTSTWKNCHLPGGTETRVAKPPFNGSGSAVNSRVTSVNAPSAALVVKTPTYHTSA